MILLKKSTDATPEERAFLQHRVALFGRTAGGCYLVFLLFRVVADGLDVDQGIEGVLADPTIWYHLLSALCFLATWAVCRVGQHSVSVVRWVETLGLLAGSGAATAMGSYTPTYARPDMVLVLALSPVLLARTLYVPSSARRTLLLAVASGAEVVVASYLIFQGVEPEKWAALDPTIAFGLVKDLKDDGAVEASHARSMSGTPQYMSPESISAPAAVDGRSDLYAVGAVA